MKQRDKMRELFQRHRGNEEHTIQAYADAEERGEVPRNSDLRGLTARDYAARLSNLVQRRLREFAPPGQLRRWAFRYSEDKHDTIGYFGFLHVDSVHLYFGAGRLCHQQARKDKR